MLPWTSSRGLVFKIVTGTVSAVSTLPCAMLMHCTTKTRPKTRVQGMTAEGPPMAARVAAAGQLLGGEDDYEIPLPSSPFRDRMDAYGTGGASEMPSVMPVIEAQCKRGFLYHLSHYRTLVALCWCPRAFLCRALRRQRQVERRLGGPASREPL